MSVRRLLSAGLISFTLTAQAAAAEQAIIVLDASGSMWGQIDGEAKIDIARKALSGVVSDLDAAREIGLMAYGHRKKGQCSDIELIVKPQTGFADPINAAVAGIKPKGKTPLSEAVRQAAEALKYTEEEATVILITDGLETCDADPCALGRQLEDLGVNFTAHVVGFGLSKEEGKQVSCLAEETGGVYIPAGDPDELVEALNETVVEAPVEKVEAPAAELDAPATVPMALPFDTGWTGPGFGTDRVEIFDPNSGPDGRRLRYQQLRNGDMDNRTVTMPAPAKPGKYLLRYWSPETREHLAEREIEVTEIPVSLTAEEPLFVATPITATWEGPGQRNDRVELWDPNSGTDGKRLHMKSVQQGDYDNRQVTLPGPSKPGMYQLRYWNADNRVHLASVEIEVADVPVTMTPQPPLEVGRAFTVQWDGPGDRYDEIRLFDPEKGPDGKVVQSARVAAGDYDARTVKIPGPPRAGTYQLHYWNGSNRTVLGTVDVEFADAAITLEAPEQVEATTTVRVVWDGPGARYDDVQIFDPNANAGDGKVIRSKRLRNDDYDNRTATMPAPAKPGDYLIRYWSGDNRTVLATRPLKVIAAAVVLIAPQQIGQAKTLKVIWQGPGARYDDVQIYDPRTERVVESKRLLNDDYDNNTARLQAPAKTGAYELRYWNGDNKSVLASQPLEVIETPTSLTAPNEIGQGMTLRVEWEGPGARYDDVQIFDPQSERVVSKKRLLNDDYDNRMARLIAPARTGTYELRYWNGDNKAVLATQPLTVVAIAVSIDGPDVVEPETKFGVTWEGPGGRYDDVQIFDPASNRVVAKRRLRNDDYDNRKASIKAPKQPGEYILRYWNGDNKAVLFERPLSVN